MIRRKSSFASALLVSWFLPAAPPSTISFEDITAKSGIRFSAENGASPEKFMIETMGSGVGLFDYNGDGLLDIVLVSGGGRPGSPESTHNRLALYRNEGSGKFSDQTAASGLSGTFD